MSQPRSQWLTDELAERRDPKRAADRRADLARRLFDPPGAVEADDGGSSDDNGQPPAAA